MKLSLLIYFCLSIFMPACKTVCQQEKELIYFLNEKDETLRIYPFSLKNSHGVRLGDEVQKLKVSLIKMGEKEVISLLNGFYENKKFLSISKIFVASSNTNLTKKLLEWASVKDPTTPEINFIIHYSIYCMIAMDFELTDFEKSLIHKYLNNTKGISVAKYKKGFRI